MVVSFWSVFWLLKFAHCRSPAYSAASKCILLQVTENELVYTFTLDYRPATLQGTPILRSSGATVGIECHYPRRHNVSNEVQPAWIPYASTQIAEEILVFSLKIMTGLFPFMYRKYFHQYFWFNFVCVWAV